MVSCTKDPEKQPDEPTIKTRLDQPKVKVTSSEATSFTVEWTEIENAVSYAYKINDGEETVTEGLTAEFTDLTPGIYTVQVKAKAADDSEEYRDSNWGSVNHTVARGIDLEELRSWIGTYDVTSTAQIVFEWNDPAAQDYVNLRKVNEGMEFSITIEQNPDDEELLNIYGLSGIDERIPAHATLVAAQDGSNALGIITNDAFVTGVDDDGTVLLPWLPIVEFQDGSVGGLQVEYSLMFINTNGYISSYPLVYQDVQGPMGTSSATVVATDVFGIKAGALQIYYGEYPKSIPAGSFDLTKTN
ncbi:MAG TPA: hypothetical protein IAC03_01720 [Candidatus Coprenecus pullistercoris]|nr:hypothetical protein [Candidatus Coprenecus pullistercoris]